MDEYSGAININNIHICVHVLLNDANHKFALERTIERLKTGQGAIKMHKKYQLSLVEFILKDLRKRLL